jgi:putative oxidoreductase
MYIATEHSRHAGRILPVELIRFAIRGLNALAPIGDLLIRLWVANVFWKSGLSKIQSVETTLQL